MSSDSTSGSNKLSRAQFQVCSADLSVEDLMSTNVVSLRPNSTLEEAETLLRRTGIRHLPVVDSDKTLVGLVSQRDLFALMGTAPSGWRDRKLKEIMRDERVSEVKCTTPETSARSAAICLAEHKIGCLPVVDDKGRIIGIITEGDFVNFFAKGKANE